MARARLLLVLSSDTDGRRFCFAVRFREWAADRPLLLLFVLPESELGGGLDYCFD